MRRPNLAAVAQIRSRLLNACDTVTPDPPTWDDVAILLDAIDVGMIVEDDHQLCDEQIERLRLRLSAHHSVSDPAPAPHIGDDCAICAEQGGAG